MFSVDKKKLKISLIKVHFIDLYSFHVMIVLYEKIFSIEKLNLAWNKQTKLSNFNKLYLKKNKKCKLLNPSC